MNNIRISCIMSVYNGQDHLQEAIESVLDQTQVEFEFIIINDASSDNTKNIIGRFACKDKRIKVLDNEENFGLAKSLNKGLQAAEGKYIIRMDADDVCMHNRFKTLYEFMEENPQIQIAGSSAYITENNADLNNVITLPSLHKDIVKKLLYRNVLIHPSVIFRRSDIMMLGGYKETLRFAQDIDLWHRARDANYKFHNLKQPLISYRFSQNRSYMKLFYGFHICFSYALKQRSFKGCILTSIIFILSLLMKWGLYKPRSLR